jgi:hypothetical protein
MGCCEDGKSRPCCFSKIHYGMKADSSKSCCSTYNNGADLFSKWWNIIIRW